MGGRLDEVERMQDRQHGRLPGGEGIARRGDRVEHAAAAQNGAEHIGLPRFPVERISGGRGGLVRLAADLFLLLNRRARHQGLHLLERCLDLICRVRRLLEQERLHDDEDGLVRAVNDDVALVLRADSPALGRAHHETEGIFVFDPSGGRNLLRLRCTATDTRQDQAEDGGWIR